MKSEQIINKDWNGVFTTHSDYKFLEKIRNSYYLIILKYINKSDYILDVGCGRGDFLQLLKERGYKNLYGIDPEPDFSNKVKKFNFKEGISSSIPYPNNLFKCIYIYEVLHHLKSVEEYDKTISEVKRCLKQGGIFISIEDNNKYLFYILRATSIILTPFSKFWNNFRKIMKMEWEDMTRFFKNQELIKEKLISSGFKLILDRRLFHRRTMVLELIKWKKY